MLYDFIVTQDTHRTIYTLVVGTTNLPIGGSVNSSLSVVIITTNPYLKELETFVLYLLSTVSSYVTARLRIRD